MSVEPSVRSTSPCFVSVEGTFFRAVTPEYLNAALSGSRAAGRYSRPDQPTLYLSSSRAGVAAAMIAHSGSGAPERITLEFQIEARKVFDLRSIEAIRKVRAEVGDPFGDWQLDLACGREPISWQVRDWIEMHGASGLIDPSRKAEGLWHLVLFHWNVPGAPTVKG